LVAVCRRKQHFVEQEKLEQPQEKELSCLQSDEVPHDLTTCLFDESSTINHHVLSNGGTTVPGTKVEQQLSSDIYEETISTMAAETPVDHSYTRWDQTGYNCVYCKKIFIGEVNFVSHQASCHPKKVVHSPEHDVIIHESKQQLFKDHKKTYMPNKEFGEDIVKINWHATDNSCLEEGKNVVSNISNIIETFKYRHSGKDIKTQRAGCLETDVESRLVLPALKISAQNMAALHTKVYKQTGHNVVEIVRMADILVEPEGSILKERKSKFRMKISKNFENIDSNVKSKIIGAIRGMIKESENKRSKVQETETTHQDGEEIHKPTDTEETAPENKPKGGIQPKHLKYKQCDQSSVSLEGHVRHVRGCRRVSFTCAQCDKEFSSKTELQLHTFMHTQEKPYICEYCGKRFRNRQALKNHLYTHDQGEKMFECRDCGKKFGTRGGYESHCASHSEALCLCDLCGKRMKHTRSLRVHRLTHIDPSFFRRHCCTICGKTCRNR
jgi:DNA-directed RNA polymerase subunit RPC12/RpoP